MRLSRREPQRKERGGEKKEVQLDAFKTSLLKEEFKMRGGPFRAELQ